MTYHFKKDEKSNKNIFLAERELKSKAKDILSTLKEQEEEKLRKGYTWKAVDSKTRILIKKKWKGT